MSELIDRYFGDLDNFSVAVEIGGFQRWLRDNHPEVLRSWLAQMEQSFLARAVAARQRSQRAQAQKRVLRTAVVPRHGESPSEFQVRCSVGPEYRWVRVGDMTAGDHRFTARRYTETGQRMLLLGAFHREIAKRLGDRRTSEMFTEEEYAKLRSSITGQPGPVSLREAITPKALTPPKTTLTPPVQDA